MLHQIQDFQWETSFPGCHDAHLATVDQKGDLLPPLHYDNESNFLLTFPLKQRISFSLSTLIFVYFQLLECLMTNQPSIERLRSADPQYFER